MANNPLNLNLANNPLNLNKNLLSENPLRVPNFDLTTQRNRVNFDPNPIRDQRERQRVNFDPNSIRDQCDRINQDPTT